MPRTPCARWGAMLLALWLSGPASAAPISTDYAVTFIPTPGPATGDVVVASGAVFVGVGAFGAGAQSVVRIDGGGTTVLADGFNSLGGFAYDAANDRLIVGDNGGDLPGAATGDTIYAIPAPFGTPATPAAAASLEILPAGALPGYADVVLDPSDPSGDSLFLTDASSSFPPAGLLLEASVAGGTATPLQSLVFAAGVAADASTLYIGEALLDFSGQVTSVPLTSPGDAPALVATLPGGLFDLEVALDGTLLATSGGTIARIDPLGGPTEVVASGFGFASGLFEDGDGVIYALDGFAAPGEESRIWQLIPIPEPGSAWLLGAGLSTLAMVRTPRRRGSRQSGSVREKRTGIDTRP